MSGAATRRATVWARMAMLVAVVVAASTAAGFHAAPAAAAVPHHVSGTCYPPPGCGLWLHTSQGLSAPRIAVMPEGAEFDVICWVWSDNVLGDSLWLEGIWQGYTGFAADYYIDTRWSSTQDLVNQGIPSCSSSSGGGGGTGGTTTPPTSPSAQWQVSDPQIGGQTLMGWAYVIGLPVTNVGNAQGSLTITNSDPGCTSSRTATLAPGATTTLRFVCSHTWSWIAPWGASEWDLFHSNFGNAGLQMSLTNFFGAGANQLAKIHTALQQLHTPGLVLRTVDKLDSALGVIGMFADSYETGRQIALMTQNKNWGPTFTANFGYSAPVTTAPSHLDVPVYVPQYKWNAYGSYVHTEMSAIAFDIAAAVTGKIAGKIPWGAWEVKALLSYTSWVCSYLAGRGHEAAQEMYIAAYDPATDYQTAPTVTYTSTSALDSVPDGPLKDWAIAYSRSFDVESARDEALVRFAGALDAGDSGAQAVQLDALQQLTAQEESLLSSNPAGEQALLSELPASLGMSDQQQALDALAAPDFASSDIGQGMVAGGMTAADVADFGQQVAQVITAGDTFDLQAGLRTDMQGDGTLLQDSGADAALQLATTELTANQPSAVATTDATPGSDGYFHDPVTVSASAAPGSAPITRIEYSIDGSAFSPYAAPLTIADAGQHTVAVRAVGTDGTVQDPPSEIPVWIAPLEEPPVAEIATPVAVVQATGGLPATASFDGTPSFDPAGRALSYAWSFGDPDGSTVNAQAASTSHTFTHYGSFAVHLTVSNGTQSSVADGWVTVADVTPPELDVPADITIAAGSDASARLNEWLAAASGRDDDPDATHPVSVTNDFVPGAGAAGVGVGNSVIVTWTATDAAGNQTRKSATVTVVDRTPPIISPQLTGTTGTNGWYTSDVALRWDVSDPDSGIQSSSGCNDATITSDTDSTGTSFTCTATSAGGTATRTIWIKRDATPPTVVATRTPAPNTAGWNNSDVTVAFSCVDHESGLARCSEPVTLKEGTGQSVAGTGTDEAGNSASANVTGINVDETPPVLDGEPTSPPNANGWYRNDVQIHWSCSDAGGSGLAGDCPADSTIAGEGASLVATADVSDLAGNITAAPSRAVKIDRTPPLTSIDAPTGWTNTGVTLTFTATDNLSGIDTTYFSLDGGETQSGSELDVSSEGRHTVDYWSVDRAGNIEQQRTVSVLIDKTAPTISHALSPVPNVAGWNNSNVTVTFTCADALSGVATCTEPQSVAGEGRAIRVVGTATDNATNSAQDTALVSIDKTPPTITAAADRGANANGWYNADVVVSFTCGDALSGVVACGEPKMLGEGASQSASGDAADAAGNVASAMLSGLRIDETPPTVSYTGDSARYAVDEDVSITCSANDALSGIATTTCANIVASAWTFGLGTTSTSASATDLAGNVGGATASFTVFVDGPSLKRLVDRFSTQPGVAAGLDAKIDAIVTAATPTAKAGMLRAFDNQISAQTGKAVTTAQANVLTAFAAAL